MPSATSKEKEKSFTWRDTLGFLTHMVKSITWRQWPVFIWFIGQSAVRDIGIWRQNRRGEALESSGGQKKSIESVIRPIQPQQYRQAVDVWDRGLLQTVQTMPIITRPAAWLVYRLMAFTSSHGNGDLANIAAHWQRLRSQLFVAIDTVSSDVIGLVAVKAGHNSHWEPADECERSVCSVYRLSVADRARRQGVAQGLMKRVHDWARDEGFTRVCLVTANPHAAAFYASLGYRQTPGKSKEYMEVDLGKNQDVKS